MAARRQAALQRPDQGAGKVDGRTTVRDGLDAALVGEARAVSAGRDDVDVIGQRAHGERGDGRPGQRPSGGGRSFEHEGAHRLEVEVELGIVTDTEQDESGTR